MFSELPLTVLPPRVEPLPLAVAPPQPLADVSLLVALAIGRSPEELGLECAGALALLATAVWLVVRG